MTQEGAFQMRGHIIGSFKGMFKKARIFRHHPVEVRFKVAADRWIGVFIDSESCTGVLDENMRDSLP